MKRKNLRIHITIEGIIEEYGSTFQDKRKFLKIADVIDFFEEYKKDVIE